MRALTHIVASAALGLVAAAGFAAPASAGCDIDGEVFYLHLNDKTTQKVKTDPNGCDLHFISSGKIDFTSAAIVKGPKNGDLRKIAHLEFLYLPKQSFKGNDDFVIKVCGKTQKGRGCSTLTYTAQVD